MSLIIDLIFPKICYGCGKEGEYLCPKCQDNISILNTHPPQDGFDGGLSLCRYNYAVKSAILDLKYSFVTDNASYLSEFMAQKINQEFPNLIKYWQLNNFILIPIPLHHSRQNWRGFNQSKILAQKLSQKISLDFSNQVLTRHQNTQPQARLKNTNQRTQNVFNIFSLTPFSGQFKQKNFIIFDNICAINPYFS
jgi:ComF family protein